MIGASGSHPPVSAPEGQDHTDSAGEVGRGGARKHPGAPAGGAVGLRLRGDLVIGGGLVDDGEDRIPTWPTAVLLDPFCVMAPSRSLPRLLEGQRSGWGRFKPLPAVLQTQSKRSCKVNP
jgi:hypothetical protein